MHYHFRTAIMLATVLVALSSFAAPLTEPVCTTLDEPIDLRPWGEESYPSVAGFPPGQWTVSTDGSSTFQSNNGQPTLFVSDFNAGRLVIIGRLRVEPGWDDDFIGFTLGYHPGDTTNPAADYLLVDWKKGSQSANFASPSETPGSTAWSGLAVSRVHGVPTADEFWGHVDFDHWSSPLGQGVEELARARTLGSTGWQYSRDYAFRFEFGEVGLRVFVDDVLELEVSGDFSGLANRRFTFYNFSQESVRYSGFTRRKLCPPVAHDQSVSTPEDTPVSITLAATDTDGDPLGYSIVTPPAFGTLSGTGANVIYTPNPGFTGTDSFTFRARDYTTNSNTATVSISVTPTSRCRSDSGRWLPTGKLITPRILHTATALSNGKVLVLGSYTWSTELYDPVIGTWAATGNTYATHRNHTATLLNDGRVLVAGGDGSQPGWFSELYDPTIGLWTPAREMATARQYHTAILLRDGTVLVMGGSDLGTGVVHASTERYYPLTNLWTPESNMTTARSNHTATLLADGRVLVVGGSNSSGMFLSSAEVYNPTTGAWTATGSMTNARRYHTATLLPNGKVLVAGGYNEFNGILTSAELFNFRTGSWCPASSMAVDRYGHTATLLPDGRVLVTAGVSNQDQASVEQYVP